MQTSADAIYGARHVGLKAGVPRATPALTVNRLCGSGIESIVQASQMRIQLGEATTVLAGGMENMSQAPHVIRGARGGLKLRRAAGKLEDMPHTWALHDPVCRLQHGAAPPRTWRSAYGDHPRGAGRVRPTSANQLGAEAVREAALSA